MQKSAQKDYCKGLHKPSRHLPQCQHLSTVPPSLGRLRDAYAGACGV